MTTSGLLVVPKLACRPFEAQEAVPLHEILVLVVGRKVTLRDAPSPSEKGPSPLSVWDTTGVPPWLEGVVHEYEPMPAVILVQGPGTYRL